MAVLGNEEAAAFPRISFSMRSTQFSGAAAPAPRVRRGSAVAGAVFHVGLGEPVAQATLADPEVLGQLSDGLGTLRPAPRPWHGTPRMRRGTYGLLVRGNSAFLERGVRRTGVARANPMRCRARSPRRQRRRRLGLGDADALLRCGGCDHSVACRAMPVGARPAATQPATVATSGTAMMMTESGSVGTARRPLRSST